jgi:ribosomal protein L32
MSDFFTTGRRRLLKFFEAVDMGEQATYKAMLDLKGESPPMWLGLGGPSKPHTSTLIVRTKQRTYEMFVGEPYKKSQAKDLANRLHLMMDSSRRESAKFCTNCGKAIDAHWAFCKECGTRL